MSFSLDVLCLGKTDKIVIPKYKNFIVMDESDDYYKRYEVIYNFMTMQEGQWFSISKEPFSATDAYGLCDIGSHDKGCVQYPTWIDDEDTLYDIFPLVIHDDVINDFEHFLRYMLHQSPLHKIMFLARLQGTYEEIVCGTIQFDKFLSMLKNNIIRFNICYIISKESTRQVT